MLGSAVQQHESVIYLHIFPLSWVFLSTPLKLFILENTTYDMICFGPKFCWPRNYKTRSITPNNIQWSISQRCPFFVWYTPKFLIFPSYFFFLSKSCLSHKSLYDHRTQPSNTTRHAQPPQLQPRRRHPTKKKRFIQYQAYI